MCYLLLFTILLIYTQLRFATATEAAAYSDKTYVNAQGISNGLSQNFLATVNDILTATQAFEWAAMVHMIHYQEGKSITELRQDMATADAREAFHDREWILSYLYMILVFVIGLI